MRKNKQGVWAKYRGVGGGLAHILKGSANNLLMTPAPRLLRSEGVPSWLPLGTPLSSELLLPKFLAAAVASSQTPSSQAGIPSFS